MLKFHIINNITDESRTYVNYYTLIYDTIMIIRNRNLNSVNIKISLETYESLYPVIIETLLFKKNNTVTTKKNMTFDLNKSSELYSFLNLFSDIIEDEKKNKYIIQSICDLLGDNLSNNMGINEHSINLQPAKTQINNDKKNNQIDENEKIIKIISSKIDQTISKKTFLDKEQSNNNENLNLEIPDCEIEKIRKTVEKLEKTKDTMEKAITNFENELEDEKENLNKYTSKFNEDSKKKKIEDEKLNNEITVYKSERDYTYKKIYAAMMNSDGVDFNKIPPLFISKFPVFLFMDGKDCEGETVRETLFETDNDNDYYIYKLLYSIITEELSLDDVEDEKDEELICKFINFLPDGYQSVTPDEVMKILNNNSDDEKHIMFREDETEAEEVKEMESNIAYEQRKFPV